jgi:hypothetical protein
MNVGKEMEGFTLLYVRAFDFLTQMTPYRQLNQADITGGF